ncbi:MAG TPA: hypothetical protein VLP43_10560 [Solirubrobacteraceae bacterium]|nr:hypothetical protein [Solirubrobacteraceae bacterium]
MASAERQALGKFAREDPLWPGQLALAAIITLSFTLPERLTVGPTWLMPAAEAVGLIGLIAATPGRNLRYSRGRQTFSLSLVGLVSATYLASLWLLVHYLVKGGRAAGHPLISAGVVLWVDNVLLFAIWYWLLDRDGPLPHERSDVRPDFMFTQMTDEAHELYPDWNPNFFDYLYLSLTNASAFSPTDTLPLTRWAKFTMGVQSIAALVTVGVVVARAVNILG